MKTNYLKLRYIAVIIFISLIITIFGCEETENKAPENAYSSFLIFRYSALSQSPALSFSALIVSCRADTKTPSPPRTMLRSLLRSSLSHAPSPRVSLIPPQPDAPARLLAPSKLPLPEL